MTATDYNVVPSDRSFAIAKKEGLVHTPEQKLLALPTRALAEAVQGEWQRHGRFAAGKMPLTTLSQTAIDRIEAQRELIVESLLVYVDTDALAYRSSSSDTLLDRQKKEWDPVLARLSERLGHAWQVTQGVMPIDQSEALHTAIRQYLERMDSMRMAAACMLSATLSSVALAIAVLERFISAEQAFALSRLEEEVQAEAWGRDPEAESRAQRIKQEIVDTGYFLDLLSHT